MHPQLNPLIPRFWRDHTTLQLDLDPQRSIAVTNLDPSLARVLSALADPRAVATPGPTGEMATVRTRRLLALLQSAGALIDLDEYAAAVAGLSVLERQRLRAEYASRCLLFADASPLDLADTFAGDSDEQRRGDHANEAAGHRPAGAASAPGPEAGNGSQDISTDTSTDTSSDTSSDTFTATSAGPGSCADATNASTEANEATRARDVATPAESTSSLADLAATLNRSTSPTRYAGEALHRRRTATVLIHGASRVGAAVACLLAAAGVGRVRVLDDAPVCSTDVSPAGLQADQIGQNRAQAARARIDALAPSTSTAPSPNERPRPDLVVLAPDHEPRRSLAAALISANLPHLYVRSHGARALVGPFVVPGHSSCLRCLDLHRGERDPAWPWLLDQALASTESEGDVVTTTLAATYAAVDALAFVEGGYCESMDATVELRPPRFEVRRRSWPPHPFCGCRCEHLADVPAELVLPPEHPTSDSGDNANQDEPDSMAAASSASAQ